MAEQESALVVKHRVDVFSAGCRTCQSTIEQLRETIGEDHELVVHEVNQRKAASERADAFGIRTLPAVAVEGRYLRAAGTAVRLSASCALSASRGHWNYT